MEHSPLPWAVKDTDTGGIIIVSADNEQVAIMCPSDHTSPFVAGMREANSVLVVEAINRQVIISDKEVQEIKAKNLRHRQTRFGTHNAANLSVLFNDTVWQVDKLLKCVEQREIIIEEILRDKGVLDQAAIPILQVREDNRQMKDALVKILDIYEGGPSSYIERADNMAGLAYKAIGRKPELGTGTEWVGTEVEDDEDDYTSVDSH